jgi:hypothetical protein
MPRVSQTMSRFKKTGTLSRLFEWRISLSANRCPLRRDMRWCPTDTRASESPMGSCTTHGKTAEITQTCGRFAQTADSSSAATSYESALPAMSAAVDAPIASPPRAPLGQAAPHSIVPSCNLFSGGRQISVAPHGSALRLVHGRGGGGDRRRPVADTQATRGVLRPRKRAHRRTTMRT